MTTVPPLKVEPITRTTLALFAGASGDHNPIHIDIDAARASGVDDVFAHGMLSMAYLGRALTDAFPQSRLVELATRFTAITPVLAEPVITAEPDGVQTDADGRQLTRLALTATLADGTVTLRGHALIAGDA
ncbi:MaoC/PaaZ C-terminal domain-containing protein [Nocardia asteroides]|uniref:MaoC/PaaZ C-terminal domain-containing protein n=1 Tax=Nocardia asteroides TaxID=1824 RepID=UPI001E6302AC|nr:MaoC/PaaZ C-terminal domain-containing protein [Nocardia asteroides]UGT62467.1 MaoC family dehydratase N-terminal domain-containing protein [Nocardia asteroides]